MSSVIPDNCPECDCELYPTRHTRPRPRRTAAGQLVLACGFLASGVVFLGATATLVLMLPIPVVLAALAACVPALSVGYAGAMLSERLGRVLKVACRRCPWATSYAAGFRVYGTNRTDTEPQ